MFSISDYHLVEISLILSSKLAAQIRLGSHWADLGQYNTCYTKALVTRSTQRAQTSLAEADHYSHIAHCKNVEPCL